MQIHTRARLAEIVRWHHAAAAEGNAGLTNTYRKMAHAIVTDRQANHDIVDDMLADAPWLCAVCGDDESMSEAQGQILCGACVIAQIESRMENDR
jgi:hypothetical protein